MQTKRGRCANCERTRTRQRTVTEPHRSVYATRRWRRIRRIAIARAGRRCEHCLDDHNLQVHHRIKLAEGGDPYALDNLEVLCDRCHRLADNNRNPVF